MARTTTSSKKRAKEGSEASERSDSASEKQEHDEDDRDSSKGSNVDTRWERIFTRLLGFREKHGHCVVPNRYPDDQQLGSWGKKLVAAVCVLSKLAFISVSLTN
jgi:hypothetical protein